MCARCALCALDENPARFRKTEVVGAFCSGGVENEVQSVFVNADEQTVDELFDDFTERKGNYGKVVAAKLQNRNTDKEAGNGCRYHAGKNCNKEPQSGARNCGLKTH